MFCKTTQLWNGLHEEIKFDDGGDEAAKEKGREDRKKRKKHELSHHIWCYIMTPKSAKISKIHKQKI